MNDTELQKRIETSAALRAARESLANELSFRADRSISFDPFLIITIISIVVQIILHCLDNNAEDDVRQLMRDAKTLPPRKLMRLKRRLNTLWREECGGDTKLNPIFDSILELGENADDDAINEILKIAKEAV